MKTAAYAAGISLVLAACATQPQLPTSTVRAGGQTFLISQITAVTWVASPDGQTTRSPVTPIAKKELISAIEKLSGCKVTDSDYSHQGQQLDTQVDCAGGIKN